MNAHRGQARDVFERLGFQSLTIPLVDDDPSEALVEALPGIRGADLERALVEVEQLLLGLTPYVTVEWTMSDSQMRHYRSRLTRGVYNDGDSLEGFTEDVTTEVSARRRAAVRTAELEALIAALPEAVLLVRRGRVVVANATARRLLGAGVKTGAPLLGLVPPTERSRFASHATPGAAVAPMTLALDESGSTWVEVVGADLSTREGTRVLTLRNVTERRRAEVRATAGDRLSSVGRLAAGVAHEINNPLTYVVLNLEMLKEDVDGLSPKPPMSRYGGMQQKLDDAITGANRVAEIIQQLRLYAHQRDDGLASGSLAEAVMLATQLASFAISDSIDVEVDIPDGLPEVAMGVGQLSQVMLNLCINGGDAMEEAEQVDGRISISAIAEDLGVLVKVVDNGPGIPPAIRESVFRPFFTTKEPGKGTGMGLSISRGLIHATGGSLRLQDTPRGASFEIFLPYAAEGIRLDETPTMEVSLQGRRQLLIVDDEPALCRALASRLRKTFVVTVAHDGAEARGMLEEGFRPDAILCDIEMPRMDGPTLIEWLGEFDPDLQSRVVVMTGGTLDPIRTARVEREGRPVMSKPLDMRTLHGALADIVTAPESEEADQAVAKETTQKVESVGDRRGAPRVMAKGIRALLDLGDEVHSAAVVDMSTSGLRLRNGVLPEEALSRSILRVLLVNEKDEPLSLGVRIVWQRTRQDDSVDYGLVREPVLGPVPPALERWIDTSDEPAPLS